MNIINKLDYNIQSQIRSDLFTVNISSCVFELVNYYMYFNIYMCINKCKSRHISQ